MTNPSRLARFSLVLLVLFALLAYARDYHTAVGPLDALTLMGGIVIGQAFAFWISQERRNGTASDPAVFVAFTLVLLLAAASMWHPNADYAAYAYLGKQRWTGPWTNPNTYGVLMGVGLVLAAGLLICFWRQPNRTWKAWLAMCLSLCAMAPLGLGLARSYSRGAWAATLAGLAFLLYARRSTDPSEPRASVWSARHTRALSWQCRGERAVGCTALHTLRAAPGNAQCLRQFLQRCFAASPRLRVTVGMAILLISLFVLLLLNFRGSENVLLRRIASIGNPNDFSWRNRVASWEGALQMMAEKPLLGHGWGRAEALYDSFYKPAKLDTGAAIQMNDYLVLGASLGIPALAAFVLLIGLSAAPRIGAPTSNRLTPTEPREDSHTNESTQSRAHVCGTRAPGGLLLRYTFAAAAFVLAVSFWFDGGLLKLSTGALFWVLVLEHSGGLAAPIVKRICVRS